MINFSPLLQQDEAVDDLQLKGLKIIQKNRGFRFGTDAVLLTYFTGLKNRESVMDLCTGTGIIPLLFSGKSDAKKIYGLEIQAKYADMAERSVRLNNLEDRVKIILGDVRDHALLESLGRFDVVTANPPYKMAGTGHTNPEDELTIARHEVKMTLEDVISAADRLLRPNGRLILVHRPERLLDIVMTMRQYHLEPKRIQMAAPAFGKAPNIMLVEGKKHQKPYLKWEPQIEIYKADGTYADLVKEIYGDGRHG